MLPGAPEARLHLVGDEQDPVLAADASERVDEVGRRDDEAALAEDELETTHATFSAATCVLKNSSRAAAARPRRGVVAVLVRVGEPVDLGRERAEAVLVRPDLARHAHRQQRAPVEGVLEDDDGLAAGRVAGDLDGVLERLGAAVGEQRLLRRRGPGRSRSASRPARRTPRRARR